MNLYVKLNMFYLYYTFVFIAVIFSGLLSGI